MMKSEDDIMNILKQLYRHINKHLIATLLLLALGAGTVWGVGEYEPVNDFTEGYYIISNANTSTGTWYIYRKEGSDQYVFATSNITVNNLWFVSKESKPGDTQLYNTEGAIEKVAEASKRTYLSHQGNGTNVRTYQTSTNSSSQTHYRMVLLKSATDGAYVMINNNSSTKETSGFCTGNASNGGAAFRMDAARDESSSFEKQLFPGSCDGDYSSWVFVPQTVTSNAVWPEMKTSSTPILADGANWTTIINNAGTYEYTFESHFGTLWDDQNYLFPNFTLEGNISFNISSPLPSGITVAPNSSTGNLTITIESDITETVSFTVTVTATKNGGVNKSRVFTFSTPIKITSLSEITNMGAHYILTEDINGSGLTESIGTFSGILEGNIKNDGSFCCISNLTKPIFSTLNGGIVRNLVLKDVNINNHDGNTGAIASTATGNSRIYNVGILSGSVGGTNNTGGLIGILDGTARVINCYSYATITGGTNVGGIVGNNNITTSATSINTMVMNCMFYGDITGGNNVAPVFGGILFDNRQDKQSLNTFNFYAYDKLKTKEINSYNSTLAVEERFLNRFEFYRLLLNSNKKLAAFYVTGSAADANIMAKWVLETADRSITNPKPYPILKAQGSYPSIINYDYNNAPDSASVGRNKGGNLGKTLSVTIYTKSQKTNGGQSWPTATTCDVQTTSLKLTRTDMDAERFNFNYDKVQLPYYNDVGSGNYTEGRVVTGWKIVSMTGGTEGTYKAEDSWGGYNFADRYCTKKDLYSVSGRVFSQGAYFDVPYGVTAITIEPYWGYASFVADERYDVVYNNSYGSKTGVTAMGKQVNSWTFNGVSVKTDINSAFGTIGTKGSTVYDNAVVLVGNFHQANINNTSPFKDSTPFTLMSVDLDNDNEPDYSLIYHDNNRSAVCPIRFDFLNIIGTAQAQKPYSSSTVLNASIFNAKGWFEITNTCLIYFSQFEYENSGKTAGKSPIILLGGVFDQFTSTKVNQVQNTTYLHVGGNAWFNDFGNGTHSDGNKSTKHIPISVTGGDYRGFYLTGTYNQSAAMLNDNAECYISGGHFGEAAGAGQEPIGGNVRWQIYNADIDNFYGGGVNHAKPILGTVTVDIMYSHVGTYCGGPKFGNMSVGKTVKTNAIGCTFGTYFGAGFGGTSYSRVKYRDEADNMDFDSWQNLYATSNGDRGKYYNGTTTDAYSSHKDYGKKGPGVAVDFDYEFFVWTSGKTGGRFFVKFASFSLAQCDSVESNLKNCIIENNYYGGGSLGKVVGTVTSELEDCTVKGNVFGAGFSASLPALRVRDAGFKTLPSFNKFSGMFQPGVPAKPTANDMTGTTEFEWKHVDTFASNGQYDIEENGSTKYVHTDANLEKSNLGSVAGSVNLTLKSTTVTGNVFGGGESSYVTGTGNLVTVNLLGETTVNGNVFGGGDKGVVECGTVVNIGESGE